MTSDCKRIAFIHPDLGIGGAERLVVDAAVGLQDLGNDVDVYTSHCDRGHCFDEARDGTLDVTVYGDFFPTHLFKKLHIFFSILRQFYLVLRLVTSGKIKDYDYFVVDQLSFCVPLIALMCRPEARILFYCHFPDQLLAQKGGLLKKLYRVPFDFVEEWTTGASDRIVVNLNFTKGIFHKTFSTLTADPGVIYPCVDTAQSEDDETARTAKQVLDFFKGSRYFLSVNRFERKKNIELAIEAFAAFKKLVPLEEKRARLVVAGGFDLRVFENVEYMKSLEEMCASLGLQSFILRGKLMLMPPATDVLFLPSIALASKNALILHAECLLYTPSHEHFGIVPVESMLHRTPVLAVNNGGPLESIVSYTGDNINEATGYTIEPDAKAWADVMATHYNKLEPEQKKRMGENGYERANNIFSREELSRLFMRNLEASAKSQCQHRLQPVFIGAIVVAMIAISILTISRFQ